jgi:TRAP-type C4-dicarboxylate transport system permease small subunit
MRRLLDGLYAACGALAALFLVLILLVVLAAIVTRLAGVPFRGAADYAGYCMAAASFLALAYTFRQGAHIRVTLVIERLRGRARRIAELLATSVACGLGWYFAWYSFRLVRFSRLLGDVSQGQDATPLWLPQLAMVVGTLVLAVALSDHLVALLRGGEPSLGPDERREV